ncbi:GerAB/ArcD/ProY family transporter [Paenibacillus arenilitoris]|uniref:GerAB/ArcD/ProY family transporter n=1 Tax=Paenibacillus arenilitoris TaxID=2772299 RepID=A0A927H981_9BACL|nr:GerAB/ArcD/ProY family transporter [Paenibacillus arenilitoris]MBD2872357.1 GerAB/ArcD/ProY family transporter [Paenibacillus arenilitoris]
MNESGIAKQNVNHFQMGLLFYVFMTGSSIINVPGPLIGKALNGAWLSLLLSGSLGIGILACILFLYRRYPDLTYVEYSRKLIGTTLTAILSILTVSFFLHMQSAIVVDVGLFMISSMLRETPIYAFTFLLMAVSAATAFAGIEVMARMFTLITAMTAYTIVFVFMLGIPDYDPTLLFPIMPEGIKPVLHGAYFTFGFPYVEVFLFAMLLPFVKKESSGKLPKTMMAVLVFNIFTLCLSAICSIMIFGPFAGERTYVLFSLARVVEFQEIVQRIESVIGMALILGSYMKTTITLFVVSLYVSQLFRFKDHRTLVMPFALIGFLLGLVNFDSAMEWVGIVAVVHPVWGTAAFAFPLLLLTIVAMFKKEKQKSERP